MRKSINILFLFMTLAFATGIYSCRETKENKAEEAIEDVKDGVEEAGDEIEDAADEVGDEIEDATDNNS